MVEVTPVQAKEADAPAADNSEARFEVLNQRLNVCINDGKITREAAARMFQRELAGNNADRLERQIEVMEAIPRIHAEGPNVITNMPERRDIIQPPSVPTEEVRPEEITQTEEEENLNYFEAFKASKIILERPVPKFNLEKFELITLPSGNLFYEEDKVYAKKLGWSNMKKMSSVLASRDLEVFVDSIASCISMDIYKLTQQDFIYFLYWLRIMSLPRTPMTVHWNSRYGTKESFSVKKSTLKEDVLSSTAEIREDLQVYRDLYGFDMPRVYDMVASSKFDASKFEMEDVWTLERVEYFSPLPNETFGARIQRVEAQFEDDISVLEELREFRKKFKHGIEESVTVQASLSTFNPEAARDHLLYQANNMDAAITVYGYDENLSMKAEEYRKEAMEIEETLKKGGKVIPRPEQIRSEIDALSFFSEV